MSKEPRPLDEIESEFIAVGVAVANRMSGLIKDIIERYECECGRPPRREDLMEHDAQDIARYWAFEELWREMVRHPLYVSKEDREYRKCHTQKTT